LNQLVPLYGIHPEIGPNGIYEPFANWGVTGGLSVWNFQDPEHPHEAAMLDSWECSNSNRAIFWNERYVLTPLEGYTYGGVCVFDICEVNKPKFRSYMHFKRVGFANPMERTTYGMNAKGNYAYFAIYNRHKLETYRINIDEFKLHTTKENRNMEYFEQDPVYLAGQDENTCNFRAVPNTGCHPIADFSQVNLDGIQASKLTGTTLDDDTIIFRWINDEYFKMVLTDLTGSVLQEGYVSEDSADWRDPSTWENIAGFYRIENFQPAENLDGTQASGVVGIPLDDESNYLHNVVEENAEGVGGWGGSCTCPDGSVYQVGDNYDHCGTLACIGGVSGECHRIHGDWSYQRVTCGVVPPADDKAFVQGPKTGCEFGYVQPATAEECQAVAQANGVKYWGGGGAGHSSAADPRGCIYRTPDRDIYFNTHSTGSTNRGDRRTVCVEVESDFVGNSRRLLDADGGSRAHLRKM